MICLCLFQQDLHPGDPMRPFQKLKRLLTVALAVVAIVLVGAFIIVRTPVVAAQPITALILSTSSPVPGDRSASTVTPRLTASPAISYHPITWKELVKFLEKDHTNWNRYIPNKYDCLDFSVDLVANAGKENIKAWIVAVDFKGSETGHAFVAFVTSDHGVVYVEPQADDTYPIVQVGKPLCDSWGVYQCMGTVSSIQNVQCDHAHDCALYTP